MNPRAVSTSRRADEDIAAAVDFYLEDGRPDTAARFVDELERAFTTITDHPSIGASRLATEAGLPGMRSIALQRFPYIAFYRESENGVQVIRVLHTRRDLFAALGPDA